LRTAHRCEVLAGRRMRAGPFLLFASREQRKCRKERTITKPFAAGLDIDIGRRIKLRRIQLGLKSKRSRPEDRSRRLPTSAEIRERRRPRVGKPAVSDRRSTWRRHRAFLRASTTPLPASNTAAVAGSIDCLGERYAIEVLECFRDMTPEQRSTGARRDPPGALLGAVFADCSAASGLFDDPVGQKPAIIPLP
jgi:hypothetical protein